MIPTSAHTHANGEHMLDAVLFAEIAEAFDALLIGLDDNESIDNEHEARKTVAALPVSYGQCEIDAAA